MRDGGCQGANVQDGILDMYRVACTLHVLGTLLTKYMFGGTKEVVEVVHVCRDSYSLLFYRPAGVKKNQHIHLASLYFGP